MKKKFRIAILAVVFLLGCAIEHYMFNQTDASKPAKVPTVAISESVKKEQDVVFESQLNTEYYGYPDLEVNAGEPFFTEEEKKAAKSNSFEIYSELDNLGRVGPAFACLSKETMPAEGEERGEIGQIKPTGWQTVKYDCVDGNYVYNRCHLIAWCLSAENDNPKNLCTGTRYMNVEGMLPYEEKVAKYLDEHPKHHVLYRATPIFEGDNLLCKGVLLEAESIESNDIRFCVFLFNVQPGVAIDYATGETAIEQ